MIEYKDEVELTESQKIALKNSNIKSKVYENNLKHLISIKFIENDIDLEYIDKICNIIINQPITTRINTNFNFFDSFIKEPRIKNKYEIMNLHNDKFRYDIENKLFKDAYKNTKNTEFVKYGSINIFNKITGDDTTKGYGNIIIFYRNNIKNRCSFVYGDSFNNMLYVCTYKYFRHLLYHMPINDIKKLIKLCDNEIIEEQLSTYIEVQIHGDIVPANIEKIAIDKNTYDANISKINIIKELYQIEFIII
jgi:hypothetical protein